MAVWKTTTPPSACYCVRRRELTVCWFRCRGELTAAIYRLVGTVRLNGLDQETYFREVIVRIKH